MFRKPLDNYYQAGDLGSRSATMKNKWSAFGPPYEIAWFDPQEFVTASEAKLLLKGVSKACLTVWRSRGKGPKFEYRLEPGNVRPTFYYRVKELHEFLDSCWRGPKRSAALLAPSPDHLLTEHEAANELNIEHSTLKRLLTGNMRLGMQSQSGPFYLYDVYGRAIFDIRTLPMWDTALTKAYVPRKVA